MKKYPCKLLVADIDGTLVNGYGKISAEDKAALAKVRDLGIQVSLCTGRGLQAAVKIINQLSLDGGYHISFDGALVSSPTSGEEVYARPLSQNMLAAMIDFAHQHRIDLEFFSVTHYYVERETWATRARQEFFGLVPTIASFSGLGERARIIKGNIITRNHQEEVQARNFCRHFKHHLDFSWATTPLFPGVYFVNLLALGVSKGKALEALASHLEIPLTEVIAVGDESNDVSLLTSAGLAIAMGTAPEEVRKVADHVTLDVDHSGLAAAVNRFLL